MQKVILHAHQCPGDTVVSTMVVESLARQFPGRFDIKVVGTCDAAVYSSNPHASIAELATQPRNAWSTAFERYCSINSGITAGERQSLTTGDVRVVSLGTPRINECNQVPVHMAQAMCEFVGDELGVPLRLAVNRPQLHVWPTEREKGRLWQAPYALLNAGWKESGETKWYSRWQEIVDMIAAEWPELAIIQVGEFNDNAPVGHRHIHPPLKRVRNMVGATSARELIVGAASAAFCLGPISFLTHICAGLEVPYVCVLTGYEPRSWAWMPGVKYVDRHGTLPCCRTGGCWKQTWDKCVALKAEKLPACLDIPPQEIFAAVAQYIDGGVATFTTTPKPQITVGTLYTSQMALQGEKTSKVLRDYARTHGYECIVETQSLAHERPPHWSKIAMVRKWLERNDGGWFFWIDADALIMNLDQKLDDFLDDGADLIIAEDLPPNRFNAGAFFVRSCAASANYMDGVWKHAGGAFREQTAMIEVAALLPYYRVKVVPRKLFNSFSEEYVAGDFIQHFANKPRPQVIDKKPLDQILECRHRGPEIRVDGAAKTKTVWCEACGDKPGEKKEFTGQKLFPCKHPAQPFGAEVTLVFDCGKCEMRSV